MLIYFQITILEKQLKSLTERIRLFNTLKFQRGWNGVTKSRYSQKTQGTKQQAIQKTLISFLIYLLLIKSGPGENRTPVQTRKPYAFYMLIFAFGFRA